MRGGETIPLAPRPLVDGHVGGGSRDREQQQNGTNREGICVDSVKRTDPNNVRRAPIVLIHIEKFAAKDR